MLVRDLMKKGGKVTAKTARPLHSTGEKSTFGREALRHHS